MNNRLGDVRPTTSKVRESLLATLSEIWPGARVLDLFAGTGSLGLAAIDEGAAEVVFVEGHHRVARGIRVAKPHRVVHGALPAALARLDGPFDIVLADPPYGVPEGPASLKALPPLLVEGAWVVFEHHHKDPYVVPEGLELWRCRRFGETALSYYRWRSSQRPLEAAESAGGQLEMHGQDGAGSGEI